MTTSDVPAAALADGGHACCFYDSDDEQRRSLTGFLREGLASGRKVMCIADGASTRRILAEYADEPLGRAAIARGQLAILQGDEAYVAGGFFDPERMLTNWEEETARAVADGYPGLRVTGDVTWYARDLPGVERLVEYEQELDATLEGTTAAALCLYDRRRLDDDLLREAADVHGANGHPPVPPETFRALPCWASSTPPAPRCSPTPSAPRWPTAPGSCRSTSRDFGSSTPQGRRPSSVPASRTG